MGQDAVEREALTWVNGVREQLGWSPLSALPAGIPCDPCACPIGLALDAGIAHDGRAAVGPRSIPMQLPPVVLEFVAAFDLGAYPGLEAEISVAA